MVKMSYASLSEEIPAMHPENASEPETGSDPYDTATDETIALCGGNARAAVKTLLVANAFLEHELACAKEAISFGYSRGCFAAKAKA